MAIANHITGIQHIGLVTKDITKTISFYEGLGFRTEWMTDDVHHVVFLRLKDIVLEAYTSEEEREMPGAIDHISLNVNDINAVFDMVQSGGYKMLHQQVQALPFLENGVLFFTIEGPNGERIEFNQIR